MAISSFNPRQVHGRKECMFVFLSNVSWVWFGLNVGTIEKRKCISFDGQVWAGQSVGCHREVQGHAYDCWLWFLWQSNGR
ncbi:hypothetical protein J1N35_017488 [Gossypium stocksii]|uniref:Uncharacterized protein n=1 Tax=Gossypium stocksii TaxID=47602 RepID=A0A9D3VM74_9ROSI|nr:hypothetical protein J1N35_017488 [Gossypium stocksii]